MVLKVLCATLITFLLMYFIGKGLMEDVVDSLCDKAFEDLHNWRLANPCTCIGDSFYAKSLVLKRIEALERLWKVFNLERNEEHITYLYSLLNDHFNPPGTRKNIKRSARRTRAVLSLYTCCAKCF